MSDDGIKEEMGNMKGASLADLGIKLVEQTSLEQKIQSNANQLINQREIESDRKRLEKSQLQLTRIRNEIRKLQDRLRNPRTKISQKEELRKHIEKLTDEQLRPAIQDIEDIKARLEKHEVETNTINDTDDSGRFPGESEKEFLIRTGKLTAFGNTAGFTIEEDDTHREPEEVVSHQNLRTPGVQVKRASSVEFGEEEEIEREQVEEEFKPKKRKLLTEDEIRNIDDGIDSFYQDRLNTWVHRRQKLRSDPNDDRTIPEWFKPHPKNPDASLNSEFKIPGDIYPSLFDYQKTGVQWLYELYTQKHGGIVSDEMGLGKTIQIISFIAGLHYSDKLDKPVLIVCPATVMTQWVNEFHTWWPPLRAMVLHSIGSGMNGKSLREEELEKRLLMEEGDDNPTSKTLNNIRKNFDVAKIIKTLVEKGHILITSYVGLRVYEEQLLNIDWGYVVLDEGHKIKNPNSNITILSKRLRTHNRVILSGTPIQNNLVELWSLFDFIFPGRLGTLPIFQEEFEQPIKIGGYANASNLEVKIGYQKAIILKDLIQPFLLRRMKVDVARDLPSKQEFVLMCRLTKYQKEKYLEFLKSTEFKINSYLGAIDTLRKICNHPDLADAHYKEGTPGYGHPSRSGKLHVLRPLLLQWKSDGHKVLLFTQTKQMMTILETFLQKTMGEDFKYMKMSGETNISKRQDMIYSFNNEAYDLFLLTTKVGGLGVNLTGADRVIIFDPDWNPSTDLQARERAWRLGQKKEVLIYRLVIGGSIEEKIYHRQIFKQLLTDKILKDPNQKRFFKNSELHDLFTLSDFDDTNESEYGNIFKDQKKANVDDLNKISKIQGITKLEEYKDETENETEDDRLMDGLFKGTAKAVKHDDIVTSHSQPGDEILEREARRAATKALEALKTSRRQVKRAGLGVPTFTGKFGAAGRVVKSNGSKLSSTSLLANMKKQRDGSPVADLSSDENTKVIENMRKYLAAKSDGFAKSTEILEACKIEIREKKDLSLIRQMLRGIAKWDTVRSGWILTDEFK